MQVPQIAVWAAIGVIGSIILFLLVRLITRKADRHLALKEVRRQFNGAGIVAVAPDACFMGFNRSWDAHWRGCGILLLAEGMLYFRLGRRKIDLTIPLDHVEHLDICDIEQEGGKVYRGCFQVAYRGADGQIRKAAWKVKQPREWLYLVRTTVGRITYEDRGKVEKTSLP